MTFASKKGLVYRRAGFDDSAIEIGTDEVGRGPLFGRTYAAAVALPPLHALSPEARAVLALARDSKTVPRAKMAALAADIQRVVRAFSVQFVEAVDIDGMNIRKAVIQAMREAVLNVRAQLGDVRCYVLADGRDLPSPVVYHFFPTEEEKSSGGEQEKEEEEEDIPVITEIKADARYVSVACAAILAKDAHDAYIRDLCLEYPALVERFALDRNMGYGTKAHLAGIDKYGPTYWHRQSFRPVRESVSKFAAATSSGDDPMAVPPQRYFATNNDNKWNGGSSSMFGGVDEEE